MPTKERGAKREMRVEIQNSFSYITYMWNLKYDTNEHIYETETNSQT